MLRDVNSFFQQMITQWVRTAQPNWFEFLKSDLFSNWMKLFHIYFFDAQENTNNLMEKVLDQTRIASKDDVTDLVDAQKLVIDLLEELTERIDKLEKSKKK